VKANNQVSLFYSYAHADIELRDQLDKHLSLLRRSGLIAQWYDRDISAGTEWADQIDQHLNTAHIVLLLISADFLSSDYCYSIEMTRALERHDIGEARVIPILLRHVDWEGAPFARLQVLPQNASPIINWTDRDLAFKDISIQIRKVVKELQASAANISLRQEEIIWRNASGISQTGGIVEPLHRNVQQEHPLTNIPQALPKFRYCLEKVNELKSIHNMLHEIEVELEGLLATIQYATRSEMQEKKPLRKQPISPIEPASHMAENFKYIEIIWRQAVLKIDYLTYFAAKEMRTLEDEHFVFDNDVIRGAPWVKDLFILQRSFEVGIGERDMESIKNLSDAILVKCRSHLYSIDKRLLDAVKELDLSSSFLMRSGL
jgi:TIR domain